MCIFKYINVYNILSYHIFINFLYQRSTTYEQIVLYLLKLHQEQQKIQIFISSTPIKNYVGIPFRQLFFNLFTVLQFFSVWNFIFDFSSIQ